MSNQVVRATSDSGCVRSQYATESGRAARASVYSDVAGGDPRDVGFRLVAAVEPRRVLEVGWGVGELAASVGRELGADVTALDRSPRMVDRLSEISGVRAAGRAA